MSGSVAPGTRCHGSGRRMGFTLIEVMGALVIFSLGVLMVLNLTDVMSRSLDRAAIQSEITARARTVADSVVDVGFAGLVPTSWSDTRTFRGRSYLEQVEIVRVSPLVLEARVTLEPSSGVQGPSYETRTSVAGSW